MKAQQQVEPLTIWFNAQFKVGRTLSRNDLIGFMEKLGCKSFASNLVKVFKQTEFLQTHKEGHRIYYHLLKDKHVTQEVMDKMIRMAKDLTNAPKNAYLKRKKASNSVLTIEAKNEDAKPSEEPIIELTPVEEIQSNSKESPKDIIELLKGQLMTLRSQIELDKARLDLMERQLDTITNLLNK